uniref:Uncharacterized protein LOC105034075 n=1 Tax=Elaeis guineensis var. tenera TaxID=51953 RepID=A0A6I9QDS9_ELAGV|nr:uncharacterized protein LOC105034075 [Elaeis guineensis]
MKSPPEKKVTGKTKSLLGGKAGAAAPKLEEVVEEPAPSEVMYATEEPLSKAEEDASKEEVKEDEEPKAEAVQYAKAKAILDAKAKAVTYAKARAVPDAKDESESNLVKNEEKEAAGDQLMEEEVEPEGFPEPGDEEFVGGEEEAASREREEIVVGEEEKEGAQAEEDEQIEISDMARKRKMKKEQEIFVGGLDRDAMQVDIKKAFEKIGKVVELWLNKDFVTNKNKGFAFVTFSN